MFFIPTAQEPRTTIFNEEGPASCAPSVSPTHRFHQNSGKGAESRDHHRPRQTRRESKDLNSDTTAKGWCSVSLLDAVRIGGVGSAVAPLEDAEVGLVDIGVVVKVGLGTVTSIRDCRARNTGLESREAVQASVAIRVEIHPGPRRPQPRPAVVASRQYS